MESLDRGDVLKRGSSGSGFLKTITMEGNYNRSTTSVHNKTAKSTLVFNESIGFMKTRGLSEKLFEEVLKKMKLRRDCGKYLHGNRNKRVIAFECQVLQFKFKFIGFMKTRGLSEK